MPNVVARCIADEGVMFNMSRFVVRVKQNQSVRWRADPNNDSELRITSPDPRWPGDVVVPRGGDESTGPFTTVTPVNQPIKYDIHFTCHGRTVVIDPDIIVTE